MQSCFFRSSFKERVLSAVARPTEQLAIFHACSLMGTVKKELQTVCCYLYEIQVSGFNGEIDCEPLKPVKKVTLRAFAWISKLSSLSSVQEITFIECHNLEDISCLKNVPSLSFRSCARLTSVSYLTNVLSLTFKYCKQVTGINSLVNLVELTLDHSGDGIRDIRNLTRLTRLDCFGNETVPEIGFIPNLRYVNFGECPNKVPDLSLLSHVHELNLTDSVTTEMDISLLSNVHTLNLCRCPGISDVSCLRNIRVLDISYCSEIKEIPSHSMTLLRILKANYCSELTRIGTLEVLKVLEIIGCLRIAYIEVIPGLQCVTLCRCMDYLLITSKKQNVTDCLCNSSLYSKFLNV
jgi:hypothetical protein